MTFAETTKKVLAERRQAFQLRLADTLRDQPSARELIEAASRLAGDILASTAPATPRSTPSSGP